MRYQDLETAAESPTWISGSTRDEQVPLEFRFNAAFRRTAGQSAFPVRVDVIVPLARPFRHGLLDEGDLGDMSAIEAILATRSAGRWFLVGQTGRPRSFEYLLYAQNASCANELQRDLASRVAGRPVEVRAVQDPGWAGYQHFRHLRRRSAAVAATLPAFPVLGGAIIRPGYGLGWACGAALALLIWMVPISVMLLRRLFIGSGGYGTPAVAASAMGRQGRSRWLADHVGLSAVIFVFMLASALFFLIAMVLGSLLAPVYSLLIAFVLGAGLTAGLWPAQLRYYASVRSRAAVR